jgi:hypothetical protein
VVYCSSAELTCGQRWFARQYGRSRRSRRFFGSAAGRYGYSEVWPLAFARPMGRGQHRRAVGVPGLAARRMHGAGRISVPNEPDDDSPAADLLGVVRALGLTAAGATATFSKHVSSKRSRCAASVSTAWANTPALTGMRYIGLEPCHNETSVLGGHVFRCVAIVCDGLSACGVIEGSLSTCSSWFHTLQFCTGRLVLRWPDALHIRWASPRH